MRGDSSVAVSRPHHAGFTPTCVGTATAWGSPPHAWGQHGSLLHPINPRVHPHMRGDSVRAAEQERQDIGSPPHAWGQLGCRVQAVHHAGFTPTCVGTARSRHSVNCWFKVHPHMRGDSFFRFTPTCVGTPPPHAWGQPYSPITIIVKRPFLAVYGDNSRQCPVVRHTPGGAQWTSARIRKPCLDRCLWRWRDETRQNR